MKKKNAPLTMIFLSRKNPRREFQGEGVPRESWETKSQRSPRERVSGSALECAGGSSRGEGGGGEEGGKGKGRKPSTPPTRQRGHTPAHLQSCRNREIWARHQRMVTPSGGHWPGTNRVSNGHTVQEQAVRAQMSACVGAAAVLP